MLGSLFGWILGSFPWDFSRNKFQAIFLSTAPRVEDQGLSNNKKPNKYSHTKKRSGETLQLLLINQHLKKKSCFHCAPPLSALNTSSAESPDTLSMLDNYLSYRVLQIR